MLATRHVHNYERRDEIELELDGHGPSVLLCADQVVDENQRSKSVEHLVFQLSKAADRARDEVKETVEREDGPKSQASATIEVENIYAAVLFMLFEQDECDQEARKHEEDVHAHISGYTDNDEWYICS